MSACVQNLCAPELVRRMRTELDAGKAAVMAKDGRIVRTLEGRGVKPLLDALAEDPDVFAGAVAMDRIVGRAAAAVYVVGKAAGVMAPVMSEGAVRMLEGNGVAFAADSVVPYIINRSGTGACPMDAATADLDSPAEIFQKLTSIASKEA